jgi:hypothetical protein
MRTRIVTGSILFVILLFSGGHRTHAQAVQTSVTGFITDTLSGSRGANALHADASKRNVASGMAKYAVYDETTNRLYILDPQDTAGAYLGQRVTITGTLSPHPMQHAGQHVNPKTNEVEDFHKLNQDSSTLIAGVLTNFTIVPAPKVRPASTAKPSSP